MDGLQRRLVRRAWENYRHDITGLHDEFAAFGAREADWLDDFALFMALKAANGGASWQSWPRELVLCRPEALERARRELDGAVGMQKYG